MDKAYLVAFSEAEIDDLPHKEGHPHNNLGKRTDMKRRSLRMHELSEKMHTPAELYK